MSLGVPSQTTVASCTLKVSTTRWLESPDWTQFWKLQLSYQRRGQAEVAAVAGVNHSLDFLRLPGLAPQGESDDGFVVAVDDSLNPGVLAQALP